MSQLFKSNDRRVLVLLLHKYAWTYWRKIVVLVFLIVFAVFAMPMTTLVLALVHQNITLPSTVSWRIVLKEGTIKSIGTHKDLMQSSKTYMQLYAMQTEQQS